MLLFNRILDFTESEVQEIVERRREQRYAPNRLFPIQATIEVDEEPRSARILDLSSQGVGLRVNGPTYNRNKPARLHLMIEDSWMDFPCTIVHVRTLPSGCRLGLAANFDNFEDRKAFLQLLQPVAIGSSFRQAAPDDVRQTDPGMHKIIFTGRPGTELNIWRQEDHEGPPQSFLCQMDDFLVQGSVASEEMQVFSRRYMLVPSKSQPTPGFRKLPAAVKEEIRRLFRWTMMNLPKEVPTDVRNFLHSYSKDPE